MFDDVNADGGVLDFLELLSILARRQCFNDGDDEILLAFKAYDPEGRGYISIPDMLSAIIDEIRQQLSDDEIVEMIQFGLEDGSIIGENVVTQETAEAWVREELLPEVKTLSKSMVKELIMDTPTDAANEAQLPGQQVVAQIIDLSGTALAAPELDLGSTVRILQRRILTVEPKSSSGLGSSFGSRIVTTSSKGIL